MELDDLKQKWVDHDRRLNQHIRLNTHLLNLSGRSKAKTAMRRLSRWLWFEVLLDFAVLLWLGSFIAGHVDQARFFLPAAAIHLSVILLLVAGIHQIISIAQIDYAAPIVKIQRRLEELRVWRLRVTMLALLLAPLLWTPLLVVTLKSLFNVNVYAVVTGAWLAANLAFGLAVIFLAVWVSRRYADRIKRFPFVQKLMSDITGQSLKSASRFLNSLADFEEECVQ